MDPSLIVALTIWAEARGETTAGRAAVASVIWNRAAGDPRRLAPVCQKPRQFSCWNDGLLLRMRGIGPSWDHAQALAARMVAGRFRPTTKATHYHADYVAPRWARSMRRLGQTGRHIFYAAVGRDAESRPTKSRKAGRS